MNYLVKYSAAAVLAAALAGCNSQPTAEETAGDARTETARGVNSFCGNQTAVDMVSAAQYLQGAAQNGDPVALFYMGEFYRRGLDGVAEDNPRSDDAYAAAAKGLIAELKSNPNALAAFALAEMAANGHGMDSDPAAAAALYEYAALKDFAPARARLGAALVTGNGVTLDLARAEQLLKEASMAGAAMADFDLYKLYLAQNRKDEAALRLKAAADRGIAEALYVQGLEAEAADNARLAGSLFLQAAEAGSGNAAFLYAQKYARTAKERRAMLNSAASCDSEKAILALANGYLDQPLPDRPMALAAALLATKLMPENQDAAKLLAALDNDTGLLLVVKTVWGDRLKHGADLVEADIDLSPVILAYRAGAVNGSARELELVLAAHAEAFYLSNSWYRFAEYQMPLEWLKGVFPKFDAKQDALGIALQYTLAAGLAGDGRAQQAGAQALSALIASDAFRPADKQLNLRSELLTVVPGMSKLPAVGSGSAAQEYAGLKTLLADMANLMAANGMILAGDNAGAYALLERAKINSANAGNASLIAFINHFCNPLLVDKAEFSRVTGVAQDKLGVYSRPLEQKYFSFR